MDGHRAVGGGVDGRGVRVAGAAQVCLGCNTVNESMNGCTLSEIACIGAT